MAAADGDHGVGGEDIAPLSSSSARTCSSAASGPSAREPVGAGARQLAALRGLVDIGGTQRVGLDAGPHLACDPARRAGGEDEFGRPIRRACMDIRAFDDISREAGRLRPLCLRGMVGGLGTRSFETIGDATLGQVVRRHLDHLPGRPAPPRMRFLRMSAGGVGDDLMFVFNFTRKVAFGSSSVTTPGSSRSSSLAIRYPARCKRDGDRARRRRGS